MWARLEPRERTFRPRISKIFSIQPPLARAANGQVVYHPNAAGARARTEVVWADFRVGFKLSAKLNHPPSFNPSRRSLLRKRDSTEDRFHPLLPSSHSSSRGYVIYRACSRAIRQLRARFCACVCVDYHEQNLPRRVCVEITARHWYGIYARMDAR